MTANWPAMTRNVWPRSRRLSRASTWSGVRLRSSGGSREFAICLSCRVLLHLRPDRLLSLIQAHTGGIAPASRQLPDFFGEQLTPDLCGFGIDITPDAFAPCCWAATSDPIHS